MDGRLHLPEPTPVPASLLLLRRRKRLRGSACVACDLVLVSEADNQTFRNPKKIFVPPSLLWTGVTLRNIFINLRCSNTFRISYKTNEKKRKKENSASETVVRPTVSLPINVGDGGPEVTKRVESESSSTRVGIKRGPSGTESESYRGEGTAGVCALRWT